MKSVNASGLLPEHLLKEVQQYIQGEALYIPTRPSDRRKWGESSGARGFYLLRNGEIRKSFREGLSVDHLSEQYGLSADSIRKIVYSKNPQS
ncbi:CD3324 family protein [Paenibacillus sp. MMS20-IR301]|uniref:CD3324 family protein n=1 Tax=Paenibacillus sp. MMS20-IR301 TaxID=2895946 RepID=UPI0028EFF11E|nr:CD3324 family protein [Paenibacillus sp. MMS20-IR301]WNS46300.1 CD3324 family protein [Paenibacillus sp. MMS20-IR301]